MTSGLSVMAFLGTLIVCSVIVIVDLYQLSLRVDSDGEKVSLVLRYLSQDYSSDDIENMYNHMREVRLITIKKFWK